MRVFGITGGSGSGKSTVSVLLSEMGAEIIDADKIAHEITEKGSDCLTELEKAFGSSVINTDGTLDRKELARLAFSSKDKTALLNRITHKYIKEETERRIRASKAELIGIDGAVIIGSIIEPLCERIVLVTADRDIRLKRIQARDNLTLEEANRRLDAQPDDAFYRSRSDYVINNSFTEDELKSEVGKLYNKLKEV